MLERSQSPMAEQTTEEARSTSPAPTETATPERKSVVPRLRDHWVIGGLLLLSAVVGAVSTLQPYLPQPVLSSQLSAYDSWLRLHDQNLIWREPEFCQVYAKMLRNEEILLRHEVTLLERNWFELKKNVSDVEILTQFEAQLISAKELWNTAKKQLADETYCRR